MNGLGGLNKSPDGVVVGVVQLQLPNVVTGDDLAAQTESICETVTKAKQGMGTMDLVVFPEYALHGLSMTRGQVPLDKFVDRPWIRVTIIDSNGRRAWSNPIWRDG